MQAVPVLVLRLDTDGHPWRLPREADVRLRLLNLPLTEVNAWTPPSLREVGSGTATDEGLASSPGAAMAALVAFGQAQPWQGPRVVLSPSFQHNAIGLWAIMATLAKCNFGDATWDKETCLLLENEAQQLLAYALPAKWQADPQYLSALQVIAVRNGETDYACLDTASPPLKRITIALPEYAAQDMSKAS
ncbi:hypothetical protein H0A70_18245 [Alcaligenaceae bacterium]|nr:hypothetical protein [Alcaligenaceae bacterium]